MCVVLGRLKSLFAVENTVTTNQRIDQAFIDRLQAAIGDGSARSFAQKAGLSPSALRSYLSGASDPTRKVLIAIASAGNVNVEWLATGVGSMHTAIASTVDSDLLLNLMKGYAQVAKSQGMSIEPDQMAEWATLRYGIIVNSGSPPQAYSGMVEMALAELALTLKERQ
jgi:transcriptional regulator with XRE-family HTH domain